MDRLYITLYMDLTERAPEGAGWYISAVADSQQTISPTPISLDGAQELAQAFQGALQTTDGELPQVTVPQLARSASGLIRSALEQQLRFAEEQAAKVQLIRRKLSQIPPPPPKT